MPDNAATPDKPELIVVDDRAHGVKCDGGGGALGHPLVWYSFDLQDHVECGYCDRLFVKESSQGRFNPN